MRGNVLATRLSHVHDVLRNLKHSEAGQLTKIGDSSDGGSVADAAVILTLKDPATFPSIRGGGIGRMRKVKGAGLGGGTSALPSADSLPVTMDSPTGRKRIVLADLLGLALSTGATAVVAPCVELDAAPGRKRHEDAVERSALLSRLAVEAAAGAAATAKSSGVPSPPRLLLPIVGGISADLRKQSAASAAELASGSEGCGSVVGFVLCGLGLGETRGERLGSIEAAVAGLPTAGVRVLAGPGDPLSVIEAVSAGIDVIDTDWPDTLASMGHALTMRLPGDAERASASAKDSGAVGGWGARPLASLGPVGASDESGKAAEEAAGAWDPELVDPLAGQPVSPFAPAAPVGPGGWRIHGSVSDPRLALDRRPLLPGCGCPACAGTWDRAAPADSRAVAATAARGSGAEDAGRVASDRAAMGVTGYSRAYLHHLHATHELLAQALLEAHNAWRYGQFLRCLQDAVRAGESGLDEFKAAFVSQHDLD